MLGAADYKTSLYGNIFKEKTQVLLTLFIVDLSANSFSVGL